MCGVNRDIFYPSKVNVYDHSLLSRNLLLFFFCSLVSSFEAIAENLASQETLKETLNVIESSVALQVQRVSCNTTTSISHSDMQLCSSQQTQSCII